jgi:Ca-activated chloride channel homolog
MTFAWPLALLGLVVVGLAALAYLVLQRRRPRYVARFTNLDLLSNIVARSPRWRRHVPPALTLLALSALVVGLARPQVAVAVPREEATVILAMDSSGSMTATDVAPDRMAAARAAATSFVEGLPDGFRVGVVSFSDQADLIVPPTTDRDEATTALERLEADNGTALGDAIARSVGLGISDLEEGVADSDERPVIVLVLSDGANTTGDFEPLEAAARAAEANVPVYTVALGTAEGTIEGPDGYGGTRAIAVPPDPETLTQVAEQTGGRFFAAADEEALRSVYDEIGSQVGVEEEERELTVAFTAAGAVLLLLGGALSAAWFSRFP